MSRSTFPPHWANAEDVADDRQHWRRQARACQAGQKHPRSRSTRWTATACLFPRSWTMSTATFALGAAAYEKRGVAVTVPTWDSENCIQCNNCAYVCPHATIRPFALTEEEAAERTRCCKDRSGQGRQGLRASIKFTMAISPLDCMGCGVCVRRLPRRRLGKAHRTMVPQEERSSQQQDVFDYCVAKVSEKKERLQTTDRQGQPVQAAAA